MELVGGDGIWSPPAMMSSQPPPDVSPPPPSEQARRSWRIGRAIWVVGTVSILLLFMLARFGLKSRRQPPQKDALSNARQIGMALFEFETEYGKFPDEDTIGKVASDTGTKMNLGRKSSNDFFRQLMASGITDWEGMFYANLKRGPGPDEITTGHRALEKGECGFTYLRGAKSTDHPMRPIVVTPMISGTKPFDRKPFDGYAVVLRLDNSVISLPINRDGHIMVDGRNLMDPGHPIWEGHPPVIAWPE